MSLVASAACVLAAVLCARLKHELMVSVAAVARDILSMVGVGCCALLLETGLYTITTGCRFKQVKFDDFRAANAHTHTPRTLRTVYASSAGCTNAAYDCSSVSEKPKTRNDFLATTRSRSFCPAMRTEFH